MSKELKRLLIVDDEEDLLWGIAELLDEKEGFFEIEFAGNAEEAIDQLAKKSFDLVVTDIRMPGMDGIQLLVEIKKVYRDTKVIIMTAYGSNLKELAKAKGAVHFVKKPFSFQEFRDLVIQTLKEEPGQLKGRFYDIDLVDILQIICVKKSTHLIVVSYEDTLEDGKIYIYEGNIVHCESGSKTGEEAFSQILMKDKGVCSLHSIEKMPKQTIKDTWTNLILSALQEIDHKHNN